MNHTSHIGADAGDLSAIICGPPADEKLEMPILSPSESGESEIRFLAYRLAIIGEWPPSERKRVNLEAVSRRLAAIARSTPDRGPLHNDLVALSCALLDRVLWDGARSD